MVAVDATPRRTSTARSAAMRPTSTDPQARLYRKGQGQEAKLCYLGHALMDNRHGLIVDTRTTEAGGRPEREAGLAMMAARPGTDRLTLGADKGYDTQDFVEGLRCANVSPACGPERPAPTFGH